MELHADYDVIILGAGPGGFTAGIYLARFQLKTLLLEASKSSETGETIDAGRSATAGCYHNVPGFPSGIPREDLKWRGIQQAQEAGCEYRMDEAMNITLEHTYYRVHCRGREYTGKRLFFAMGVTDIWPELPGLKRLSGRTLYWSVESNGHEAVGKPAAVIGNDEHSALEAIRLTEFTPQAILLTMGQQLICSPPVRSILEELQVPVIQERIKTVTAEEDQLESVTLENNEVIPINVLFSPVQTRTPRSQLAQDLGVHVDANGFIQVDERYKTNIPGIYAVGDITARGPEQVITSYYQGMIAAWDVYESHSQHRLEKLLSAAESHAHSR